MSGKTGRLTGTVRPTWPQTCNGRAWQIAVWHDHDLSEFNRPTLRVPPALKRWGAGGTMPDHPVRPVHPCSFCLCSASPRLGGSRKSEPEYFPAKTQRRKVRSGFLAAWRLGARIFLIFHNECPERPDGSRGPLALPDRRHATGEVSHRAAEGLQPAVQESEPEYFPAKTQRRKVRSGFLAAWRLGARIFLIFHNECPERPDGSRGPFALPGRRRRARCPTEPLKASMLRVAE